MKAGVRETAQATNPRGCGDDLWGFEGWWGERVGWSGDRTLGLAGGSGRSGWACEWAIDAIPRRRRGRPWSASASMAELVVDAGARAPAGQSGMASTAASGPRVPGHGTGLPVAGGDDGGGAGLSGPVEDLDDDHAPTTAGHGGRGSVTARVQRLSRRWRTEQLAGTRDLGLAAGAGEEAVVADAVEALRQHVEQEAAMNSSGLRVMVRWRSAPSRR